MGLLESAGGMHAHATTSSALIFVVAFFSLYAGMKSWNLGEMWLFTAHQI